MVRTRIAPSPTGEDLHIGNLYTALFNWAFARKHKGHFIVRVEDTDQKRLIQGSEQRIMQTLKDFGLDYDEGIDKDGPFSPYRQSERLDLYKKYAEQLVEQGHAYYCFCTPDRLEKVRKHMMEEKKMSMYDRHCRNLKSHDQPAASDGKLTPHTIRMKIPDDRKISFQDEVRGEISVESNTLDDQVILKSDGYPTYHLAVVVDDHLMEISHVIRGEEWISSTPKHILLHEFFGWEKPTYIHMPLLRNSDRSKLSKRKNPVWASWYLQQGFLPDAVLNFLALMGWSHPKEEEIFSLEEFVEVIDLSRINTVGPIFDMRKLEWMNGEYIRQSPISNLQSQILKYFGDQYPKDIVEKTTPLIQERIKTLKEYDEYCRFFIEKPNKYEINLSEYREILKTLYDGLEKIGDNDWKADNIGENMQVVAKDLNISFSKFFMYVRVAITGKKVTPPLNESMEVLGKKESLQRLQASMV
ncbi:glutamate--tRNA ligase [Candidatus Roizmanbacteria bacterium RIFCSPLOWO2_02_FULL_37_19]|uniref:Glutamate--tRNA ligase n=1 Tax=Candidatus Roizmanbacteria bacterium RIFCSPHIGHO2_02_FULL_37_24 TaxID=1802037 RepID=A0A1F7H1Y6_9BACT|nr:MAG: glutamate--tRNA ligase [Candidatus Roizmanbacteria bacterium RIFCSPHIGHO2_01_FULL_38_41]OGK24722.1 MAG: glutamate--tRNA ligase [Candidatus Roizmanbacteria bacterium RIFCSPHIGHO2_02_FULL_37_24]OGK32898.1 MAG: glutamate--tRNA ligase [Candidatus Roizmanbacteria bacterium RIFCSPHIGHO2_12_FULL_37_23]OGK44113.1 MAG: glutamate--tRNA ligase [Candidatus Roizmanbacteria bacterium RIFCSPLOWO2_01_FULL_37_57]OGK54380.1 MAG: glutamate--tRNA ligase [Candidatus Roizmanbacteria bacterium RIFCSPLOWO2_02_